MAASSVCSTLKLKKIIKLTHFNLVWLSYIFYNDIDACGYNIINGVYKHC